MTVAFRMCLKEKEPLTFRQMTAIIGTVGREPGGMLWRERCLTLGQSKMEAVLVRRE